MPLLEDAGELPVGQAQAYLPGDGAGHAVDDMSVSLERLAGELASRPRALGSQGVAFAALQAGGAVDPRPGLGERLGLEVRLVPSEATAARCGALATPGARADAAVLDLGGGTVDVITGQGEVVAAGGGDLLTVVVAALLGASRSAAEWAKRGPCPAQLEAPQLLLTEDGGRVFLDTSGRPTWSGRWSRRARPGCSRSTGRARPPSGGPCGCGRRPWCSGRTWPARCARPVPGRPRRCWSAARPATTRPSRR